MDELTNVHDATCTYTHTYLALCSVISRDILVFNTTESAHVNSKALVHVQVYVQYITIRTCIYMYMHGHFCVDLCFVVRFRYMYMYIHLSYPQRLMTKNELPVHVHVVCDTGAHLIVFFACVHNGIQQKYSIKNLFLPRVLKMCTSEQNFMQN